MTDGRHLDLDALRINEAESTAARSRPKPSRETGLFLKGPVSWAWLCAAGKLKGSTLQVAIACQFLAGMTRSDEFSLRPSILRQIGVERHAAYRALAKLEDAELIVVRRHRGRAPVVRVLHPVEVIDETAS